MSGWLAPVSAMDGEMVSPDMAHAKPGVSTLAWPQGALGSTSALCDGGGFPDGNSETATRLKPQCPWCTKGTTLFL